MFNKVLFDKNAFNRGKSLDNIEITMLSQSGLETNLLVKSPLPISLIGGSGGLLTELCMQQNVGTRFSSGSELESVGVLLEADVGAKLDGTSSAKLVPHVKAPFSLTMSSEGGMKIDQKMFLYLITEGKLRSDGALNPRVNMLTDIRETPMIGSSEALFGVVPQLPLTFSIGGSGDFKLSRLGALNENTIELIGVDLQPGGTVTIDTDLLQVLIGAKEDVSHVSTSSVFFELSPGENEIRVLTDTEGDLEVVAIWQNRWL